MIIAEEAVQDRGEGDWPLEGYLVRTKLIVRKLILGTHLSRN